MKLAGLVLVIALVLPASAQARLKPVTRLKARAGATSVVVTWRDRSRGETRYEVIKRSGANSRRRKVKLRAGRRRWTDRRVVPGTRYRYTVRACRRRRCARGRSLSATTPREPDFAGAGGPTAPGGAAGTPTSPPGVPTAGSPVIGGCPVFPKSNPWNTDVSRAPVDTSHDYIGSLGSMVLWPDFGGAGEYGIPYVTVPFTQPLVPISFDNDEESDPGPYPTPLDAPVEGGGDRHVISLRRGDCKLFELYAASRSGAGWAAYSGAAWNLRSNALRPEGWTSADAAGLPILPGLVRRDEVEAGLIRHALRITVPVTQRAYIHPATHYASGNTDHNQPPMGLRLRLKANYDISGLGRQARVVAQALKTYGALVADNAGSPRVYISGATDPGWDDDDLGGLKHIPASALEAVDTGPVVRGD